MIKLEFSKIFSKVQKLLIGKTYHFKNTSNKKHIPRKNEDKIPSFFQNTINIVVGKTKNCKKVQKLLIGKTDHENNI